MYIKHNEVNKEIALDILKVLPEDKKTSLIKALERNDYFTTTRTLGWAKLTIYKEGFYLELSGTQCGFKVYAIDNDGDLEITRKPVENKLHKLYEDRFDMHEDDYQIIK